MKIFLFSLYIGKPYTVDFYYDVDKIVENDNGTPTIVHPFSIIPAERLTVTGYHPEKLSYIGITVAGVHTGSVVKRDAYHTIKSENLGVGHFKYGDDVVTKIRFSENLRKIADEKIGELFENKDEEYYYVYKNVNINEEAYLTAFKSNNASAQVDVINQLNGACIRTDTCFELLEFLKSAICGEYLTVEEKLQIADIYLGKNKPVLCKRAIQLLESGTDPSMATKCEEAKKKYASYDVYEDNGIVYPNKRQMIMYKIQSTMRTILKVALVVGLILFAVAFVIRKIPLMIVSAIVMLVSFILLLKYNPQMPERCFTESNQ